MGAGTLRQWEEDARFHTVRLSHVTRDVLLELSEEVPALWDVPIVATSMNERLDALEDNERFLEGLNEGL